MVALWHLCVQIASARLFRDESWYAFQVILFHSLRHTGSWRCKEALGFDYIWSIRRERGGSAGTAGADGKPKCWLQKKRLEDTSRYFYQSMFKYIFISLCFSKKKCEWLESDTFFWLHEVFWEAVRRSCGDPRGVSFTSRKYFKMIFARGIAGKCVWRFFCQALLKKLWHISILS
jgi:hypothetical protein